MGFFCFFITSRVRSNRSASHSQSTCFAQIFLNGAHMRTAGRFVLPLQIRGYMDTRLGVLEGKKQVNASKEECGRGQKGVIVCSCLFNIFLGPATDDHELRRDHVPVTQGMLCHDRRATAQWITCNHITRFTSPALCHRPPLCHGAWAAAPLFDA